MVKFLKYSRLIDFISLIIVCGVSFLFTTSKSHSYSNPGNILLVLVAVLTVILFLAKAASITKLDSIVNSLASRTVYTLRNKDEFTTVQLNLLKELEVNKCGSNIVDIYRVSILRRGRVTANCSLESCEPSHRNKAKIEENKKLLSLFSINKPCSSHVVFMLSSLIITATGVLMLSVKLIEFKDIICAIGIISMLMIYLTIGDIFKQFGDVELNINLDSVSEEDNQGYYFILESLKRADKSSFDYFKLYNVQNEVVKNLIRLDKVAN